MTGLREIGPSLWCLDSHFKVWGCKGSTRMSVIGVADGLVLYSPVSLSKADIAHIESLGRVHTIIAPNLYHHMYLRAAAAAFPQARVLVPDGLERKIGPIPRAEITRSETGLSGDLDHHVFSGHALREICLFHRPSGSLITADLLYNFHAEQFAAEKAFFRVLGIYGRPGVPFYHRFAIENKAAVRQLIDMVRTWPVRRIVPCHGRIVEHPDAGDAFAALWEQFA